MKAIAFERGEDCLEALALQRPDSILMDLHMPGRSGDACCRMIKETPAFASVPVIMFTAADAAHEVMLSWRAGADDFLPKPVRLAALAAKLNAIGTAKLLPSKPPAPASAVLLVDDSRFFRTVLGSALEQSGFRVLYAKDFQEAVVQAEAAGAALDAAVIDLVMPGPDGLALARKLRTLTSFGTKKPIVLLSSSEAAPAIAQQVLDVAGGVLLAKKNLPIELIASRLNGALHPPVAELRANERVPFFSVVKYRVTGSEEWLSGFSYDVSGGGIFVRSLTPTPPGCELEMQVKFTFRSPPPTSRGKVMWSNPYAMRNSYSYPVGMGVCFTQLEEEDRAAVQSLVSQGGAAPTA